jgi:hypothetical protein
LVRDQGVGGSNPLAPTNLFKYDASALAIPVLLNSLEGWVTDPIKLTKENVESALSGAKGILKPVTEGMDVTP